MNNQLNIFSNQWNLMRYKDNRKKYESFKIYESKARQLVAHMEVLSRLDSPGALNDENRRLLTVYGADIHSDRLSDPVNENDIVTNYHVAQLLALRIELLDVLKNKLYMYKKTNS